MKKVKTIGAVVADHPIGSTIEVTDKNADYLIRNGYAELVEEPKKAEESKPKAKAESAPSSKKSDEKPKSQRKSTKK